MGSIVLISLVLLSCLSDLIESNRAIGRHQRFGAEKRIKAPHTDCVDESEEMGGASNEVEYKAVPLVFSCTTESGLQECFNNMASYVGFRNKVVCRVAVLGDTSGRYRICQRGSDESPCYEGRGWQALYSNCEIVTGSDGSVRPPVVGLSKQLSGMSCRAVSGGANEARVREMCFGRSYDGARSVSLINWCMGQIQDDASWKFTCCNTSQGTCATGEGIKALIASDCNPLITRGSPTGPDSYGSIASNMPGGIPGGNVLEKKPSIWV